MAQTKNASRRPTMDEIRSWPATVSVQDAAMALGISRAYAFKLINQEEFPCRVLTLGLKRHQVLTESLIRLLDDQEDDTQNEELIR